MSSEEWWVVVMYEIESSCVSTVSGVRGTTPGHTDIPGGPWQHSTITVINVKTIMRNAREIHSCVKDKIKNIHYIFFMIKRAF